MQTPEISCLKHFMCRGISKERAIFCSREVTFPCFGYRRKVANCLPLTVFVQPKFAYPISSASSSSSQTSGEDEEETQVLDSKHQPDTTRIHVKLKKKCEFGQRFTLVGDDPVLGLWNPCDGVPLNWSEGDVWTADIDIPSGKIINYKFILMTGASIISWQPGSDRSLEATNIESNTIVFKDWDDVPEMQNIVEEREPELGSYHQSLSNHGSSSLVLPVVNQPELEKGSVDDETSSKSDDPSSSNRSHSELIIADTYTIQEINAVGAVEQDGGKSSRNVGGSSFSDYKDEEWLVSDKGAVSPVPGLVSLSQEQTGEAEEENQSAIENTLKTENPAENELTAVKATEQLEEDLHWGKKTILKFLANFGFQ